MRRLLLVLPLLWTACTMDQFPEIPQVAESPSPAATPATAPEPAPMPATPPLQVMFVPDAPQITTAAPPPRKRARTASPTQIIAEAQQAARVAPTKRGYFGETAVQRFQYQAGKIYDVYVTMDHGTKIVLPMGQRLRNDLVLPALEWDIQQAIVGDDEHAQSMLIVHPKPNEETGAPPQSRQVSLVTQTGHYYDLYLIVGKVGMLGVTWELAPTLQIQTEQPLRAMP